LPYDDASKAMRDITTNPLVAKIQQNIIYVKCFGEMMQQVEG
jgi:hypothetical protein